MKKKKIEWIETYSQWRHRANIKSQALILIISSAIIIYGFKVSGRFQSDLMKIRSYVTEDFKGIDKNIYLHNPAIDYQLYVTPSPSKGIYIPTSKIKDKKSYIEFAKDTGVNSFIIDVKNDTGYLTFSTDNQKLVDKGIVLATPPIQDISELMHTLYEYNIYPIARVVAFKDSIAAKRNPELAMQSVQGGIYKTRTGDTWLNPYDKRNWDYLLEICKEAKRVGFKEIQFDYIRFHESMDEDRVILDNTQSKTEIITEFIKYISEKLHNEGIKISVDVFGAVILSDLDASIVGQDFVAISQYVDYISPMIYPSHYANGTFGIEYPNLKPYNIVQRTMSIAQSKIEQIEGNKKAKIRPWLQDFTMKNLKPYQEYGEKEIRDQIRGAYDAGVKDWIFWNASGKYTGEGLKDVK